MKMRTPELRTMLSGRTAVLWDFDGVILDSMSVRDDAFRSVLSSYPEELVEELIRFHRENGGWSRYVKFRYFQKEILEIDLDEELVTSWSYEFSNFCRDRLVDPSRLIRPCVDLLESLSGLLPMHVVSGSDGNELNMLCKALGLTRHFASIEGSPATKQDLVAGVIARSAYLPGELALIGDSRNDQEAAMANGVTFIGVNSPELIDISDIYWQATDD